MEHFKNLLDFINELNESGRIQYDDYSRLFDLAEAFSEMEQELDAAKTDIAALLWLNGDCQYCAHGEKEEFSGANRWHCRLGSGVDCRAVWRGVEQEPDTAEPQKAEPTSVRAKAPTRVERMFGAKETWNIPDRQPVEAPEGEPKQYKGFLLIRCGKCGKLHGFCAKAPIAQYQCRDCGGFTPLHDLTSLQLHCKCGGRLKYKTNVLEDTFTYNCLTCGAPVDLAFNKKAHAYQTVL